MADGYLSGDAAPGQYRGQPALSKFGNARLRGRKAATISGFGDERQCIDRSGTWDWSQELVSRLCRSSSSATVDLFALPDQAVSFGNDDAEHTNDRAIAATAIRSMCVRSRKHPSRSGF
ncbi:hypothetical protein FJ872_32740 [Mesorhizobium sp. B2-5-9]|nr:hypothetical protein FJ872_32740 [Mesorhizobium sp. B2-5-9]